MGLFGGSTKSTTNTTQIYRTVTNTTNVDSRQDNRRYVDARKIDYSRTNIDARQDNRQYVDRSDRSINDNRRYTDSSIALGDGAINAAGNIEITEIDNGAVDAALDFAAETSTQLSAATQALIEKAYAQTDALNMQAFQFAETVNAGLQQSTGEALEAAYQQSSGAYIEQSQQNMLMMAGLAVIVIGAVIWVKRK